MSCDHSEDLLNAFLDGETDLPLAAGIERSVRDCPRCARALLAHQALRSALRSGPLAFTAPPGLRRRVESALRAERKQPVWRPSILRPLAAIAGSLAAAAALAVWVVPPLLPRSGSGGALTEEIVADHIRSLQADHLTDVVSTDQHTVKPWFNGRLDFSPEVRDLADQGFPLAGGRLDVAGGREIAALVYRRRQHVINLFVWPAPDASETGETAEARRGFNVIRWTRGGFAYAAASDLNAAELRRFVEELKEPTGR